MEVHAQSTRLPLVLEVGGLFAAAAQLWWHLLYLLRQVVVHVALLPQAQALAPAPAPAPRLLSLYLYHCPPRRCIRQYLALPLHNMSSRYAA